MLASFGVINFPIFLNFSAKILEVFLDRGAGFSCVLSVFLLNDTYCFSLCPPFPLPLIQLGILDVLV